MKTECVSAVHACVGACICEHARVWVHKCVCLCVLCVIAWCSPSLVCCTFGEQGGVCQWPNFLCLSYISRCPLSGISCFQVCVPCFLYPFLSTHWPWPPQNLETYDHGCWRLTMTLPTLWEAFLEEQLRPFSRTRKFLCHMSHFCKVAVHLMGYIGSF